MKKQLFKINREIREQLLEAYEIPEPLCKKAFLKSIRKGPEISMLSFVKTQAAYIRTRVWILWTAVFGLALYGAFFTEEASRILWMFAALTPFLAAAAVTEHSRSIDYGMAELEKAACFSLKRLLFARMLIMGTVHLVLLFLFLLGSRGQGISLFHTGIFLLIPYLLTSVLCLLLTGKIHGREAGFACLAAAVFVSLLQELWRFEVSLQAEDISFPWQLAVFLILAAATAREYGKMIRRTIEMV